jgi:hypothetical protein
MRTCGHRHATRHISHCGDTFLIVARFCRGDEASFTSDFCFSGAMNASQGFILASDVRMLAWFYLSSINIKLALGGSEPNLGH